MLLQLISSGRRRIPVDLTDAVVVAVGNSLTYGYDIPLLSWPAKLSALPVVTDNNITVHNKGVNSKTTTMLLADADTEVDPLYNPSVYNVIFFSELINDIAYNGGTAEAAYQRIVQYYNERKAVGWRTLICTAHAADHNPPNNLMPSGDTFAVYWSKVLAANDMIVTRDDISKHDKVFMHLWPEFANETNHTYFQADDLHTTEMGNEVKADYKGDILTNLTDWA